MGLFTDQIFINSLYNKVQPSTCFQTLGRAFQKLDQVFEKLGQVFKKLVVEINPCCPNQRQ